MVGSRVGRRARRQFDAGGGQHRESVWMALYIIWRKARRVSKDRMMTRMKVLQFYKTTGAVSNNDATLVGKSNSQNDRKGCE